MNFQAIFTNEGFYKCSQFTEGVYLRVNHLGVLSQVDFRDETCERLPEIKPAIMYRFLLFSKYEKITQEEIEDEISDYVENRKRIEHVSGIDKRMSVYFKKNS